MQQAIEASKKEVQQAQQKKDPKKPILVFAQKWPDIVGIKEAQLDVTNEEPLEYATFEEIYQDDAVNGELKLKLTFTKVNNKLHYAFYLPNDQVIAVGKEDPVSRQKIERIVDVKLKKDGDVYTLD